MKILFVGNLVPEKYSIEIESNSLAGNKFQTNFLECLKKSNACDVLSFVAVPLTDKNKMDIKKSNDAHNFYYFKDRNPIISILKYRNKLKQIYENYDLIFAYNVAYPWLFLPSIAKKKKTVLILADFSDTASYTNLIMKMYAKICKSDIRRYKYVIGLSEKTNKILKNNQRFLCMPGGIDISNYKDSLPTKINEKLKIMYSGNLSITTGIDLLLKAFGNIKNDNIELIITGRGSYENELKKVAVNDSRIKYYGSLPYNDYLKLLNQANILINPRNMNLPENNNNFPSKVLDYLATGKVVVSTKFVGYEKFVNNFNFCESTIEDIQSEIEKVTKKYDKIYMDTFKTNINMAKEFDWNNQIKKVLDVIGEK